MAFSPFLLSGSEAETAVDDVNSTGGEAGFVAREMQGQRRDLLGGAEAPHGLARDEGLARVLDIAEGRDAIVQRGGLDGAGADRVAADALLDEVCRDRLGEPDHC